MNKGIRGKLETSVIFTAAAALGDVPVSTKTKNLKRLCPSATCYNKNYKKDATRNSQKSVPQCTLLCKVTV